MGAGVEPVKERTVAGKAQEERLTVIIALVGNAVGDEGQQRVKVRGLGISNQCEFEVGILGAVFSLEAGQVSDCALLHGVVLKAHRAKAYLRDQRGGAGADQM